MQIAEREDNLQALTATQMSSSDLRVQSPDQPGEEEGKAAGDPGRGTGPQLQ